MKRDLIVYHGSQQIVETPMFGVGKKYNDYGCGFYCTENNELAKEWACPVKKRWIFQSIHFAFGWNERYAFDPRRIQHPQLAGYFASKSKV